jgi:hypothetical protein
MKKPGELRVEAQRLLDEARRTADKERRRKALARALRLATEAEAAERGLAVPGPRVSLEE